MSPSRLLVLPANLRLTKPPKLLTNQTMCLNTDKEHRGGLSEAAYLCVILLVEGSAGGRRRDCLISTVWDWPLNPKTIKASQLCAEGPGSLHIHKHHLKKKKAQLVTGWPGFSLHFTEMTYIILFFFLLWIKKGTSYIFPSIIHIYRTYAFMKVYLPACFTSADTGIYAEYIYVSHRWAT